MTRLAAVLSCLLGVGFGVSCLLGTVHLARTGEVWTFLGFPTYGDGPFARMSLPTTVWPMPGFLVVCVAEIGIGVALWTGASHAVALSHLLLPFELAFWTGFALPFGPLVGLPRTLLLVLA
jgi:hypothetical protein